MNPTLIIVVVVLLVLVCVVLYTNTKESYTQFWEHAPIRDRHGWSRQCRSNRRPNYFKCLAKTPLGQAIWNRTQNRVSRRMNINSGPGAHLYNLHDYNSLCPGRALICTSEAAFVDHLKNTIGRNEIIGNESCSGRGLNLCGPVLRNNQQQRRPRETAGPPAGPNQVNLYRGPPAIPPAGPPPGPPAGP